MMRTPVSCPPPSAPATAIASTLRARTRKPCASAFLALGTGARPPGRPRRSCKRHNRGATEDALLRLIDESQGHTRRPAYPPGGLEAALRRCGARAVGCGRHVHFRSAGYDASASVRPRCGNGRTPVSVSAAPRSADGLPDSTCADAGRHVGLGPPTSGAGRLAWPKQIALAGSIRSALAGGVAALESFSPARLAWARLSARGRGHAHGRRCTGRLSRRPTRPHPGTSERPANDWGVGRAGGQLFARPATAASRMWSPW